MTCCKAGVKQKLLSLIFLNTNDIERQGKRSQLIRRNSNCRSVCRKACKKEKSKSCNQVLQYNDVESQHSQCFCALEKFIQKASFELTLKLEHLTFFRNSCMIVAVRIWS